MTFAWLKRFTPQGLLGRAALILVLPFVLLQVIVLASFITRYFDDVTEQMVGSMAYDIGLVTGLARAAPELETAQEAIGGVGDALGFGVTLPADDRPAENLRRPLDFSGLSVIAWMNEFLDGIGAIALPDIREAIVWMETPHGDLKLSFDRRRVSASNPHQLVVIMLFFGIILTAIAYVYMRNQLRPITRLADAAQDFGKGRIVRYHPSGATEVRAAGRAFLEMRARIERQTQTRTMMLSGVSHDLRTPLTRLKLGLSMLEEEDAAPLRQDLDEMQHLLDAFLDFARSDSEDVIEEIDPADVVQRMVEARRAAGQAVEIGRIEGPEGELTLLRPLALRRSVDNLVGNALRYAERVRVSVITTPRSLRILVEDDGPGIPPDRREEATRPFTRLDPARNQDRGSGVGLGLAIVADVARTHGGELRLGDSAALGGLQAEVSFAR
ncbi:ATP-binding protein [Pelagovum pacificum]|uniref:histidine kinase n=1 Tax=Pelagovum pacificum TaxID=2588711 RepID=A0A5C5GEL0_9RHOB|nr:ATP-binding protein [Pelagovum pacificum]QQA44244.1 HAMP domain-containing protein [Pelagovum pacificum]TNY32634.1 HAMP domain-containing protein [Pelagovum pacificum]